MLRITDAMKNPFQIVKLSMNARPAIESVVAALKKAGVEGVLIGNAAAALHGAPVTTDDFDIMFRDTRVNVMKLQIMAHELQGSVVQPHYPLSKMYRIIGKDGIQVDMMGDIDGIKSFESLRSRAIAMNFAEGKLYVSSLEDVIKSKKAANRKKDKAVLSILEATLREKKKA